MLRETPMSWWQRLVRGRQAATMPIDPGRLPMSGWELVRREPLAAYWRDATGDAVSLTLSSLEALPALSDTTQLRHYCRRMAEGQNSGLVEVTCTAGINGPSVTYIYKRLKIPAFTFFGIVATPIAYGTWIWTMVAYERGVTGQREAVVTTRLIQTGQLTLESYEGSWARDPYDPLYLGVDRRTLRYLSDAEEYDDEFPAHPLTKVRRELRRLLAVPLSPGTAA